MVEGEYYLQRQPHLTIEPDVGFAYFDEEGRLTIHSKSIGIYLHHAMIAPASGIEPDKLRMVQNPAGGTFGYKFSPTMEALLGVAAMATGRRSSCYDYFQHITYTGKRSPFFIKLKFGADKDGKILAMETDWTVDHGPYSEFGDLLTLRGAQFIGAGYDIPNIRGIGRTVCTNHAWGSAFRAYGSPQSFLASESLMDELAEKMGMDPLELRYMNVYRPGATTPTGQAPEVYQLPGDDRQAAAQVSGGPEEGAKAESTPEKKKGVGISLGIYGCGLDGPDASEVRVELTPDGRHDLHHLGGPRPGRGHGDAGHGPRGPAARWARPGARSSRCMNDTALTPNSGPAGGSRQQVVTGNAIKNGCEQLLNAMSKPDGGYRTYDEMVAEKIPLRYTGKWTASMCTACDANCQGEPFSVYMYGVFMAEVAVDIATGKTTVEKYTVMADIGKINNKLVVDGQIYGGMAQGIGLALSEDFEDLKKHTTLAACGIPYAKDIPDDIEILYVENPRENGPFGAAGVGELPLTSPHVAIINAIHNACGVRIRHLPALPEKVLAGLKSLGK